MESGEKEMSGSKKITIVQMNDSHAYMNLHRRFFGRVTILYISLPEGMPVSLL